MNPRTAVSILSAALASAVLASAQAASPSTKDLDAVLGRVPDPEHGRKLYESCAACHQRDGQGVSNGTIPAIAGQPFRVIARQLTDFRRGARVDSLMQHFSDTTHLSYSQEVADVASYISRMPPRVGAAGPTASNSRAAMTYQRKCERCHGPVGEGSDEGFAPRLAGQHADYLIRQLTYDADIRPALKEAHAALNSNLSREEVESLARALSAW
jgi:cytochrome c553